MRGKALRYGEAFAKKVPFVSQVKDWLRDQIWVQKMNSPLGLVILAVLLLPLIYLLSKISMSAGFTIFIAMAGLPLVAFCLFDLTFGLMMMLGVSLAVVFEAKFVYAPIGTLLDLLILIGGVSVLLRQLKERDWSFGKNPIGYIVLIWLYYNFLQVLNPEVLSKLAWLYTIRSVAIQQLVFFIAAYAFQRSKQDIYNVLKFIIIMSLASVLYGLKQEFIGFSIQETIWVNADRLRFQLYYQWGRMRIMSFCWDPTTFGIWVTCFGVFCVAMIGGVKARWKKIFFGVSAALSIWVMAYTGTRTAFVLLPLGLAFYGGLVFNKKVVVAMGVFIVLGTGFVLKSTSSGVIWRIQSAFKPKDDESMNLRLENQAYIQPYIQTHPIGGGLGACGEWAKRFTPDSELAKFPHDSSFVRMAVELGWIGLILYSLFFVIVLYVGLYYYVRVHDPTIKAIYAGILCWIFMLVVACYVQEAILQLPTNIIYNIFLGILVTLKNFDPNFRKEIGNETLEEGHAQDEQALEVAELETS